MLSAVCLGIQVVSFLLVSPPNPHTFFFCIWFVLVWFICLSIQSVAYPGIVFKGGSTNSVEDRGQREWGSGGHSPLVRGSVQFAIRFDFVKLSGCRGLLRMYFPRNWEFSSALSKLRNLYATAFSHICNTGHINYRLQFIYYNTTYNIWTSIQYNK
jgi:hypothetical protein